MDGFKIMQEEQLKKQLRAVRERVCFPVINRGPLWYDTLSAAQRDELAVWYRAWLDVTHTMQVPKTPVWLQQK